MKIVIAGGTGFLGEALTAFFEKENYQVMILTRNPILPNHVLWDARTAGSWRNEIEGADVLINLTGKSVDCRYSEKNKAAIYASRIESTNILQKVVAQCQNPPKVWLNSSSATIYMHAENVLMKEADGITGDDFSMNICKSWERAFFDETNERTRKVALRTSIVLGNSGGAFPKLKMITRLGLGGMQGLGTQKFSWIHLDDFCEAVAFIIKNESIIGVVNVTSPEPVRNENLMTIMRRMSGIPFGINAPKVILELAAVFMQTETELLLKSRNVFPEILLKSGFEFKYRNIAEAVKNLS
jgi:uncharacterized protein (TIGR01777 family)